MARELMRRTGVHHIPVISAGRRLYGLLSTQDLTDSCTGTLADVSRRQVGDLVSRSAHHGSELDRPLDAVAEDDARLGPERRTGSGRARPGGRRHHRRRRTARGRRPDHPRVAARAR